jgi:hypothetical protein
MLSNQMLSGIPEVDLGIEWVKSKKRKSPIDQSNMLYGFFRIWPWHLVSRTVKK